MQPEFKTFDLDLELKNFLVIYIPQANIMLNMNVLRQNT